MAHRRTFFVGHKRSVKEHEAPSPPRIDHDEVKDDSGLGRFAKWYELAGRRRVKIAERELRK